MIGVDAFWPAASASEVNSIQSAVEKTRVCDYSHRNGVGTYEASQRAGIL
jgi:hypothetical protein